MTSIFSLFLFAQKVEAMVYSPINNETVEIADGKESVYLFDFELGTYCGEFYLKILTHDFYPDYNLFSWDVKCVADQKATVSEWIYPYDASFAEAPYLYKRLTFDSVPIPQCTISLLYDGAVVMTKNFVITGQGSFM